MNNVALKTEVISAGKVIDQTNRLIDAMEKVRIANPAICFDVDETLLFWGDSSKEIGNEDPESYMIHPIIWKLFKEAKRLNYKVFIITARPKSKGGFSFMVNQLKKLGFDLNNFEMGGMYMMPKKYYESGNTGKFKYEARKDITSKFNVNIVAMVGDQWTDIFEGGRNGWNQLSELSKLIDSKKDNFDRSGVLIARPDPITKIGFKLPDVS